MIDDDGNVYAQFGALGVSLLVERDCSIGEAFQAREDLFVEGPAVWSLTASLAGEPGDKSGWPGVRVVEKPLLAGEQVVTVAVDPGAQ